MQISETIINYLKSLKISGYSESTVIIRSEMIKEFARYLDKYFSINDTQEIESKHVRSYILYVKKSKHKKKKTKLKTNTIYVKLGSVKNWLNYLFEKDIILEDLTLEIPKEKKNLNLPKNIPSEKEVEKFCSTPDITGYLGYRDRLIIEIMYCAGLRISEVLNLKVSDIDMKYNRITVESGKGSKTRILPLPETVKAYMTEYLVKVRKYLVKENSLEYLILTKNGDKAKKQNISKRIRAYGITADIKKGMRSHKLRHAFSIHMLKKGCDIKHISVLLGHESLKTTQIYTEIEDKDLREKFEQYHFYSKKK